MIIVTAIAGDGQPVQLGQCHQGKNYDHADLPELQISYTSYANNIH